MPEVPCTVEGTWDAASLTVKPARLEGSKSGSQVAEGQATVWLAEFDAPPPPAGYAAAPQGLVASNVTGVSFTLTWAGSVAPEDAPVLTYNVYVNDVWYGDTTDENTVVTGTVDELVGSQLAVDVTDLSAGTEYVVTVEAVNVTGPSDRSVALRVRTLEPVAPDLAPNAPTNLTVPTIGETTATLRWQLNGVPTGASPIEFTNIYRGGSVYITQVDSPTNTVTLTGLAFSTTYTFSVRADNGLESAPSNSVTVKTLTPPEPPPPPPDSGLPYTADSFFKSRVDGAGVPINATRTTAMRSFMKSHPDQGGKGINWPKLTPQQKGTSTTFHVGVAADPVWKIASISGGSNSEAANQILKTQGFHMADVVADRIVSGTADRPFLIVDTVWGYSLFCADVVPNKANRTVSVSAAGVFHHATNGLDYRNPKSNSGNKNFVSRGRIPDSMIIRPDLIQKGIKNGTGLGHTLQFFWVETLTSDGFCHPMVAEEGSKSGWGTEGERLRVKPSVDLVARGLTGGALVIARTLQQHGAYLGDNSGSSTRIKGAEGTATYNPYAGTNVTEDCLKGKVTWDDFEVVEKGWQ